MARRKGKGGKEAGPEAAEMKMFDLGVRLTGRIRNEYS